MVNICHVCEENSVTEVLDFGPQPICNRFLHDPMEDENRHPMVVGQCTVCGMVQIPDPVSAKDIVPPFDWISYNEPEGHLDELVNILTGLDGITKDSTICGVSYKDDTILRRFQDMGFKLTWRIDPKDDFGLGDPRMGIETIQERLRPETAKMILRNHRPFDLVIVRHILEHACRTGEFMKTLKQLVAPSGYIVFECPDCSRAFETFDYTALFEEHITYFTPNTFQLVFGLAGLSLIHFQRFPNAFENSLVGIARPVARDRDPFPTKQVLAHERRKVAAYSEMLPRYREKLIQYLSQYTKTTGQIALFGAGHRACTYVNLLGIKDYISFFVDDNPHKAGLFMPGSHLPIYASSRLIEKDIRMCLLGLSPEAEEKVLENNSYFTQKKGKFYSIFPLSEYALRFYYK